MTEKLKERIMRTEQQAERHTGLRRSAGMAAAVLLEVVEDCDHEVGICFCDWQRTLENLLEDLNKANKCARCRAYETAIEQLGTLMPDAELAPVVQQLCDTATHRTYMCECTKG